MFDIGFFELLVIATVALLVIGPERLPETIRTISLWIGRLRRSLRETRTEFERHIGADEIRRQLHNEEIMRNINSTREEIDKLLNQDLMEDDEKKQTLEHEKAEEEPNNIGGSDTDEFSHQPHDNGLESHHLQESDPELPDLLPDTSAEAMHPPKDDDGEIYDEADLNSEQGLTATSSHKKQAP